MRGLSASSKTYSNIDKSCGKNKQSYAYNLSDRSKLTCMMNVPGHSWKQCKVLNYVDTRYTKIRPFKQHRQDTTAAKKFNKSQYVNAVAQNVVYGIILYDYERKFIAKSKP